MTIPSEQTSRILPKLTPIGLILLTLIGFWSGHTADFFNYDDPEFVTQNPLVMEGWKGDRLYLVCTSFLMGLWAPVIWMSYLLHVEWFGIKPGNISRLWRTIPVFFPMCAPETAPLSGRNRP